LGHNKLDLILRQDKKKNESLKKSETFMNLMKILIGNMLVLFVCKTRNSNYQREANEIAL
jgi:hypothetical protein